MKNNEVQPPILITGSHRCGSTWLASLLGLAKHTTVLQEPFNIAPHFYALDGVAKHWFSYAPDVEERKAEQAFKRVLERRAGRVYERRQPERYLRFMRRGRLIIKDPIAAFSSEWLFSRFNILPLVLVRHPAAFAASLKRVSWYFPFEDLARQHRLVEEILFPYRNAILNPPDDIVEQAALLWTLLYYALNLFAERNPDWTVVRHEDVSEDPVSQVRELYGIFKLKWDAEIESQVRSTSEDTNPIDPEDGAVHSLRRNSRGNIKRWKRILSASEVAYIRDVTGAVSEKYYDETEW